jgi:hypothetical protein
MCNRCITEAIDYWDQHVARWFEDSDHKLGADEVFRACRSPEALHTAALPEPYVGDPGQPGLAVLLNLNPGREDPAQLPGGAFYATARARGYSAAVRSWTVASATVDWWSGRSRWPARLLGDTAPRARPLVYGLDVFPWHSKRWPGLRLTAASLVWITRRVLIPAGAASANTKLGEARMQRGLPPVVLGVGTALNDAICRLTRKRPLIAAVDAGWPQNANGAPVNRTIALHSLTLRDPHEGMIAFDVLVTWAPGGNNPPAAAFDQTVKNILGVQG